MTDPKAFFAFFEIRLCITFTLLLHFCLSVQGLRILKLQFLIKQIGDGLQPNLLKHLSIQIKFTPHPDAHNVGPALPPGPNPRAAQ